MGLLQAGIGALSGVLADSLTLTDTAGGEAVKEWDINGESAVIGVKRV